MAAKLAIPESPTGFQVVGFPVPEVGWRAARHNRPVARHEASGNRLLPK
ncbi:MAG: hypothetical protein ACREFR_18575 [Limisphaerales bacterium]